jgi:hypothetical protein
MSKAFSMRTIPGYIPPYNLETYKDQQLPPIATYTALKNIVFSGGLNGTVGTTRSKTLDPQKFKRIHITFFHWSIKGAPNNIPEIQLYAVINGQTIQIIRHGMPLYPWGIGQTAAQEEYQDRVYNFNPPLIITPATSADTINVKCDGSSDGNFCLVYYEEPL